MRILQSHLYQILPSSKDTRKQILDEFCQVYVYDSKYTIRLFNGLPPQKTKKQAKKPTPLYRSQIISILPAFGQPKAILGLWDSKPSLTCGCPRPANDFNSIPP